MNGLLRLTEVATRLGVCERTLRKIIKSGDLACIRLSERITMVAEEDLQKFLSSRQVTPKVDDLAKAIFQPKAV